MPSRGNSKYFPTQSHKKTVIAGYLQDSSEMKARRPCYRRAIATELYGCNSVVQTLQYCSTYIVKPSRKFLTMLAAPVRTSCAFTARYRSKMATKILQALHRHCKMSTLPSRRHLPTSNPCLRFQKMFNSPLDCLR
jgi:hypothetical protein